MMNKYYILVTTCYIIYTCMGFVKTLPTGKEQNYGDKAREVYR